MVKEKNMTEGARVKRIDQDLVMEIDLFNELAQKLRDVLNREVRRPFEIDPVLTLDVDFDESIKLNEFLSREIFNSNIVEISGVKIKDSFMELKLKDGNGNYGQERVYLGQKEDNVKFWEYVLVSLVSWHLSDLVMDKKERLGLLIDDLRDIMDSVKN